jgi:YVTN family beta-propeller protein
MTGRGIVMVANMGDDSIAAYGSETYREVFRIKLTPAGTKLMSTNHFARGPVVGPGFLCQRKAADQLLAVNIYDDSLSIIDLPSHRVVNTIFAGNRPNRLEVFEQCNRAFVTNYDSDSVSVIDLCTQQIIGQIPCGIMPQSIVLNQLNNCLYIANTGSNRISVIDALFMDKTDCLEVDGYPVDICCDDTGQKLYAIVQAHESQQHNCLIEYDIESGRKSRCTRLGTMPVDLVCDDNMERLYVLDAMDNRLTIIDSIGFSVLEEIKLGKMPVSQSLEADGKYLHVACMMDNRLYSVDLNTGLVTDTILTGVEPACVLALC